MEGYTVASSTHQYLNIQAKAVDWVKKHVKTRREMRRNRRYRKTPCRQPRWNRLVNKIKLMPSTKSRWQWKLRIATWLSKIYPITVFVVEDIKATAWGDRAIALLLFLFHPYKTIAQLESLLLRFLTSTSNPKPLVNHV